MSDFFSILNRMKYINRWGLMNNTHLENLNEHCFDVAVIAHALALIANKKFGCDINVGKVMAVALYHDASEIFTGDMPTPVKYLSPEIAEVYKQIEQQANSKLINLLPDYIKDDYKEILQCDDPEILAYVKAADKIAAYIKCIDEEKMGNKEFLGAKKTLEEKINAINLPAVVLFKDEFLPSYYCTLDQLTDGINI